MKYRSDKKTIELFNVQISDSFVGLITKHNRLDTLKWVNNKYNKIIYNSYWIRNHMSKKSIKDQETIDILEWLGQNNYSKILLIDIIKEIMYNGQIREIQINELKYFINNKEKFQNINILNIIDGFGDYMFHKGNLLNLLKCLSECNIDPKETALYEKIIMESTRRNDIELLQYCKINYNNEMVNLSEHMTYIASIKGNIETLSFLKNQNLLYGDTKHALRGASENNKIIVLEWFKNNGLSFLNVSNAIIGASYNGHENVLNWFINNDFNTAFDTETIDKAGKYASQNVKIHILNWFLDHGFLFQNIDDNIIYAASNGHVIILEWYKNNKFEFKKQALIHAIGSACQYFNMKSMNWFKDNNYEFYDEAIEIAVRNYSYRDEICDWLKLHFPEKINVIDVAVHEYVYGKKITKPKYSVPSEFRHTYK